MVTDGLTLMGSFLTTMLSWFEQHRFLLLGALKSAVYGMSVVLDMDFIARLVCAIANIPHNSRVFELVRQSIVRRCNAYIVINGGNFKHLLRHFHVSPTTAHVIFFTNKLFQMIAVLCLFYFCTLSYYFPMAWRLRP